MASDARRVEARKRAPGRAGVAPVVRRRTRRITWRRVLVATALLVLPLIVAMVYSLLAAQRDMKSGVAEFKQVQAELNMGKGSAKLPDRIQMAQLQVGLAQESFSSADAHIAPFAPILDHLGWIPRYGEELAAAPTLARMSDDLSSGALSVLTGLGPVASQWSTGPGGHHLPMPMMVQQLSIGHMDFAQGCAQIDSAMAARRSLGSIHTATVASSLHTFDKQAPRLSVACRALALLPMLLGYPQPHQYLLAYQNQNELRATGGFIGSAGLLTASNGVISQQFHGGWFNHQNTSIAPPEPQELYNGEPAWLFMDSNWSPNFPTSAALERYFLNLNLHQNPDGVIDVTPSAVQKLLTAIGPMYLPEYHEWVSGSNVVKLTDYYTHWSNEFGPLKLRNKDDRRKQFIEIVAKHFFHRVDSIPLSRINNVITAIGNGIKQRDILVNFRDPQEQALVVAAGADGSLNATHSDYLYVVHSNLSYNKISQNVHVTSSYHATVRPDGWVDATLTMHWTNVPFPRWQDGALGPGAGKLGGWDDYAEFTRIYVPLGSEIISQDGWRNAWSPGTAYGRTMFAGYLIVRRGASHTVHLHYVIPPNVLTWSNGNQYRLVQQHQPGSHPDLWQTSVTLPSGVTRSWTAHSPITDQQVTVAMPHLTVHPLALPAPTPVVVAPGHWIEPHAYLGFPKAGS